MFTIRPLTRFSAEDAAQVTGSYTVTHIYRVHYHEDDHGARIELALQPLPEPVERRYDHFDADTLAMYAQALPAGFSWGAYLGDELAGVLLAEAHDWNHSLWVWEFHVAPQRRGLGIGRALMEHCARQARAAGLRTIICETQNRNATAIQIYRRLGFRVEGIDISYYTNEDYPERDVAVFMKRRL